MAVHAPSCSRSIVARVLLLFGALCALPSHAGVTHDPALHWRTLYTPHFTVHYHDGAEELARAAAAVAERAYARYTRVFDWRPAGPIEIVVTDEFDVANGYATPLPDNRIVVFTAPPDSLEGLEDHDGWLETVVTHELVHILHLDKARGAPRALRRAFGRLPLLFPNLFQPLWLIEGLATHYETDFERGVGRGQSSFFDMLMRMEVAGGVKPLRQVNQQVDTWPGGHVPYLYGVYFHRFVAEHYGEESLRALVHNYSDNLLPFFINRNSRQTFGRNLLGMWEEFEGYLEQRYRPALAGIEARGVRAGERLTHAGYFTGPLRADAAGNVYYIAFDGRDHPALMVWRPGAFAPQHLARARRGARLDVHPVSGILLAQPEVCRNTRYYYDLYRVDPDSGRIERLTRCGRYRYGVWAADGQGIVAVQHVLGGSRLVRLDVAGREQEVLWAAPGEEVIADPDVSSDGERLVASVWRRETGWNLELFSLAERSWRPLTADAAIEAQPRFSADGRYVYFSSDHGGVYNLRRLDLADGRIETLSNVPGGAFYPAPAPDALYYVGYGPDGFDLYRLASGESPLPTPEAPIGPSALLAERPQPDPGWHSRDYRPWSGLRPRWWFPHLVIEPGRAEIGAVTSGWDSLQRHLYALNVAYDVDNKLPLGAFDYLYDRWYPIFKLHVERGNRLFRDDGDVVRQIRRADAYHLEVVLPDIAYERLWSLHFAVLAERESDVLRAAGVTGAPATRDSLAGTALVFDSTRHYPLSVSRSHGREARLVAESSDAFGGDYSGKIYTLDWREFLALGREHVLALRYVEARGTQSPRPLRLGGTDSAPARPLPLASAVLDSPFNRRDYALRGYPEGRADLQGRRLRLASLEWRFPVARVERGIMAPPLALHQLSGVVFVDSGTVWQEGGSPDGYRTGAGLELMTDAALFYSARFSLRLGYAHGFDTGGQGQVYLRIGAAF